MKKIGEYLGSTCIIWLPILALAIANWLSHIITAEMIITGVKVLGLICLVMLFVLDIISKK